jgi:enoyl-CoA hydratase
VALDAALELAARVAANGPLGLIASKRIINERPDWSSAEMWKKQAEIAMPVLTSKDAREGAAAFAEKRKPNWTGE